VVHEEINLKSSSEIIHSHLIALVKRINKPKCVFRMTQNTVNEFLQNFKNIYHSEFPTSALPHCLMRSLKRSRKLATVTAFLIWQKCLEFRSKKTLNTCMHCSLTVITLILLYGCHCSSVWFPSRVTLRFPASRHSK